MAGNAAASLWIKLGLTDSDFDKGLKQVEKKLIKFGRSFEGIGKSITKLTLPLIALGAFSFKAADDMGEAFKIIRAGTGAMGKDFEGLKDSFKNVLEVVDESAGVVGKAIADLHTRTGLTGKALETLARQMVVVNDLQKGDITETTTAVTRIFGDWSISTQKQGDALDYLFKVSQQTGPMIKDIGENLVFYGAPLRQLGFSFEQAAVLMGKFMKEGVNTKLVLGSMRIGLGKLSKAGEDPPKAFLRIITEIKNMGTTAEANIKAVEIFGARAGPDMAAAIREGRFEINDLITSLQKSKETIIGAHEEAETFGDRMKELRNKLEIKFEPIGKSLQESFIKIMPAIEKVLDSIGKLTEKFANLKPETQENIIKFALFAIVLGPAIIGIGKMIGALGGLIKIMRVLPVAGMLVGFGKNIAFAFSSVAGGAATLKEALVFLIGPIGILIGSFALLGVAGWMLYKDWDKVLLSFRLIWDEMKIGFLNMAIGVNEAIGLIPKFGEKAKQTAEALKNEVAKTKMEMQIDVLVTMGKSGKGENLKKALTGLTQMFSQVKDPEILKKVAAGMNELTEAAKKLGKTTETGGSKEDILAKMGLDSKTVEEVKNLFGDIGKSESSIFDDMEANAKDKAEKIKEPLEKLKISLGAVAEKINKSFKTGVAMGGDTEAGGKSEEIAAAKEKLADAQARLNGLVSVATPEWMTYITQLREAAKVGGKTGEALKKVADKIEKIEGLKSLGDAIGGDFGQAINDVTSLYTTISNIEAPVKAVQESIGQGFWAMLGPIGALIGAVKSIGGALQSLGKWFSDLFKSKATKNMEKLQAQYKEFADQIKEFDKTSTIEFVGKAAAAFKMLTNITRGMTAEMLAAAQALLDKFMAIAQVIESGFSAGFSNAIKAFLTSTKGWRTAFKEDIKGAIIDGINEAIMQETVMKGMLGPLMSQLTEALTSQFKLTYKVGETPVTGGGTALPTGMMGSMATPTAPSITAIIAAIGTTIPGIADFLAKNLLPLREALDKAFGTTTSSVNSLGEAANSAAGSLLNVPDIIKVQRYRAMAANALQIPQMASGGYVAPRPGGTIVNLAEKGRGEYVIPEGSNIGGGSKSIVINIHGNNAGQVWRELKPILQRENFIGGGTINDQMPQYAGS